MRKPYIYDWYTVLKLVRLSCNHQKARNATRKKHQPIEVRRRQPPFVLPHYEVPIGIIEFTGREN